ncbi:hypothetical protein GOP47_0002456 [Adiantum capillus-veneris]|uniref:Uncharacterized protein n=1 Tax=Adiantum capillus-veneris TaxID=13818 RepID=A0A9D4VBS7_ADICA|nr:hypothetical protein GOP47_0002456 [Adiantum capillus-veneris]
MASSSQPKSAPLRVKIKIPPFTKEEEEQFAQAGLKKLYDAMQKPMEKTIAEEVVRNFDKETIQTSIKGVTIRATRVTLHHHLGMATKGQAWTPYQVAQYLKEYVEATKKRNTKCQGIPTAKITEHNKIMRFLAQAICLKKDDKHLFEHVFLDIARVFKGGQGDWAKLLAESMANQMQAVTEKGHKLYTCAPIWQELYYQEVWKPVSQPRGPDRGPMLKKLRIAHWPASSQT